MKNKLYNLIQPVVSSKNKRLLTGSVIFFLSTTIVHVGNYVYNLILGRWLGPATFSDLSVITTLFLMVLFITSTLQLIAARFTAISTSNNDLGRIANLRKIMLKWAWTFGAILFVIFGLGAKFWQIFFHTQSYMPFVIFGIGLPFYLAQSVNRGVLQGQTRFFKLAASYQVEMLVRLIAGVGFVALGWGVNGAVAGLSLSFFATWLISMRAHTGLPKSIQDNQIEPQELLAYSGWVSVTYLSQILINNSDIIIVKHFYSAEEAGYYAALALIGRAVFFVTWSVVTTLFPIIAQRHQKGQPFQYLLWVGLGIVAAASSFIILASYLIPDFIVTILFGDAYLVIAPYLWLYALATGLYALANVVINFNLSIDKGGMTIFALIAGITQIVSIWIWHDSIEQIVILQIVIMSLLLLILLLWNVTSRFFQDWGQYNEFLFHPIRKLSLKTISISKG